MLEILICILCEWNNETYIILRIPNILMDILIILTGYFCLRKFKSAHLYQKIDILGSIENDKLTKADDSWKLNSGNWKAKNKDAIIKTGPREM